jgi:hypothetical protein
MQLLFLYGPAAAGKLTTARAISALTGIPVFHNHLVVNALLEVFAFGSPEFVRLRELFWLETFGAAASSGRSLVFTFTPEGTVSAGFARDAQRVVESAGGAVAFVRLEVSASEQERRIENPDRRATGKLADLGTLRRIRASDAADLGHSVPQSPLPEHLTIDTDHSSPEESARLVVERFGLVPVDQPRGFL